MNVDFWYMPNDYNVSQVPFVAARFVSGTGCQLDTSMAVNGERRFYWFVCLE